MAYNKEYREEYNLKNSDRIKIYTKEYNKNYWLKNKERLTKIQVESKKEKKKNDPEYRKKLLEKSRISGIKRGRVRLRLRFEILKICNFTCQYCGRKAPDVMLQIDHIRPISKGGINDPSNFTVACADCNMGKGDSLLLEKA